MHEEQPTPPRPSFVAEVTPNTAMKVIGAVITSLLVTMVLSGVSLNTKFEVLNQRLLNMAQLIEFKLLTLEERVKRLEKD